MIEHQWQKYLHFLLFWPKRGLLNFHNISQRLFISLTELYYEVVKSQRGRDLLLVEGHTYARGGGQRWICSTHHPTCKAKLKLDNEGKISLYVNNHNHESKYIRTQTGYIRSLYRQKQPIFPAVQLKIKPNLSL